MNKIFAGIGLFLALSGLQAETSRADALVNCETSNWTITLDDDNQSTKEDLLGVIDLIGENGGFHVTGIVSFASSVGGRFLFITFNPGYYLDTATSARVKRTVLHNLAALRGIAITCNPKIGAPGGITGSN